MARLRLSSAVPRIQRAFNPTARTAIRLFTWSSIVHLLSDSPNSGSYK